MHVYLGEIIMNRENVMPATLRLNKEEQRKLHKKSIEINRLLMSADMMPIKESELAHALLGIALDKVKLNRKNEIIIDM